jgi:hypothetical protein
MSETRGPQDESKDAGPFAPTTAAVQDVQPETEPGSKRSSSSSRTVQRDATLLDEKRASSPVEAHPSASSASDEQTAEKQEVTTTDKQLAVTSTDEKQDTASAEQDGPEDDEAHHVSGLPRLILVFGLCATTFIIGLDQMIIATAIPKITTLFQSLDEYVFSSNHVPELS